MLHNNEIELMNYVQFMERRIAEPNEFYFENGTIHWTANGSAFPVLVIQLRDDFKFHKGLTGNWIILAKDNTDSSKMEADIMLDFLDNIAFTFYRSRDPETGVLTDAVFVIEDVKSSRKGILGKSARAVLQKVMAARKTDQ
jgi:hypothetical protein